MSFSYDKLRGNGVGAYVIWFVVDGEKEPIIKTFEGDMSASIIKFNAISEIFKICSKRQIKHLNLHYGYHKIEELCCGKMRLTNQEAKNMKWVNFIVVPLKSHQKQNVQ